MGAAHLDIEMTYSEMDGESGSQANSLDVSYTERTEHDLNLVGAGSYTVSFGTVTSGKVLYIRPLDANVSARLDAEGAGHLVESGKVLLVFGGNLTGLIIDYSTTTRVKVIILGD